MKVIDERHSEQILTLERRLVEFYNTCATYPAFLEPSLHPVLWEQVLRKALSIRSERGACRILEIGAGRSGFGEFLRGGGSREGLHLTSQDITVTNVEFLRGTSDAVVTENIDGLQGTWDVIFHSYVYEHLCRPRAFNERLWSHLSLGGYLLIQSPRYDIPWYFPPCFDHLPFAEKLGDAVRLAGRDLLCALGARPQFTIFSDPAILHLPYRRDRDAVHRVRRSDIVRFFAGRARITDYPLSSGGVKDWVIKNLFTLRIALQKSA